MLALPQPVWDTAEGHEHHRIGRCTVIWRFLTPEGLEREGVFLMGTRAAHRKRAGRPRAREEPRRGADGAPAGGPAPDLAPPATAAIAIRMAAVSLSSSSGALCRGPGRPILGLPTWLRSR